MVEHQTKVYGEVLRFCDTKVQLDTPMPPIYGTAFSKTTTKKIDFPARLKITGIKVDEKGIPEKKKEYRKTNNKYARDLRNMRTTTALIQKKIEEKQMTAKQRRDLEKTVSFWELLLGKKFVDKKTYPDDKGLYRGKKVITDIFKEARQQILVGFKPDIEATTKERATPEDINNSSWNITPSSVACRLLN